MMFKKWFCPPKCSHWDRTSRFYDLHRGGNGEIYFRNSVECNKCGKSWVDATKLPEVVTKALDETLYIGTLRLRHRGYFTEADLKAAFMEGIAAAMNAATGAVNDDELWGASETRYVITAAREGE